ncbi:MAG: hypothetical protein ACXWCP_07820, partial [Burkholderiales bacterium]
SYTPAETYQWSVGASIGAANGPTIEFTYRRQFVDPPLPSALNGNGITIDNACLVSSLRIAVDFFSRFSD